MDLASAQQHLHRHPTPIKCMVSTIACSYEGFLLNFCSYGFGYMHEKTWLHLLCHVSFQGEVAKTVLSRFFFLVLEFNAQLYFEIQGEKNLLPPPLGSCLNVQNSSLQLWFTCLPPWLGDFWTAELHQGILRSE